jgi:YidC/Oxa1 family membrane protein insertase
MSWLMDPIEQVITWILLQWHWVWDAILPNGQFLGTNWDWVLAIAFLVITVRIILFPIFVKQIRSQRAMQALAPKVKELQAKYKNDRQTLQQEMMQLYREEKVNPLMGCLPMLLQIPVFFGLFRSLRYISPTETNKTLHGWTEDKFDSAVSAHLFGAPIPASFGDNAEKLALLGAHGVTAKIVAAVLIVIMMFTTFMTSRQMILKTGWQQEPQQRMIQKLMLYGIPISLLLSGWYFPIGVIIYWVTQNIFSYGQQRWVLSKYPPLVTTPTPKSAREREAAAAKKEPGALARFFLVIPPPPKPAGTPTGMQALLIRLGLRQKPVEPPKDATPRAAAPRPGAKPKAPAAVSSSAAKPAEVDEDDQADSAAPTGGGAPKVKQVPTVKAIPTVKAAPKVTATPTLRNGSTNGATPAGTAGGTPAKAAQRSSTPARKGTPPRKGGQPNRKGGGKR